MPKLAQYISLGHNDLGNEAGIIFIKFLSVEQACQVTYGTKRHYEFE